MTDPIRLVDLGAIAAARTQSIYHALAEEMSDESPDTIIFCRPISPYVCVGFHQPADAVLDFSACEREGLPILRRQVGGGTTLLDSDQFFYQCIFHRRRMPSIFAVIFQELLHPPVHALCSLGLNATLDEVNEIRVDGTRIAGTGGGVIGEACVVVGNVLFDFNYRQMARIWRVPSEACRDLAYSALHENVTTLGRLGKSIAMDAFGHRLADTYAAELARPLVPGDLTSRELERAEQLGTDLQAEEFIGLREGHACGQWGPLKIAAGVFIHFEQADIEGQAVDGCFWTQDGVIRQAVLSPDTRQPLASQLAGVPLSDWRTQLAVRRADRA